MEVYRIIDWYDGVVQALVQNDTAHYHVSLIAWDVPGRRRSYAALRLSDAERRAVEEQCDKNASEQNWRDLHELIQRIWGDADSAEVWTCGDSIDKIVRVDRMPVDRLTGIVGGEVDEALSAQRIGDWFTRKP